MLLICYALLSWHSLSFQLYSLPVISPYPLYTFFQPNLFARHLTDQLLLSAPRSYSTPSQSQYDATHSLPYRCNVPCKLSGFLQCMYDLFSPADKKLKPSKWALGMTLLEASTTSAPLGTKAQSWSILCMYVYVIVYVIVYVRIQVCLSTYAIPRMCTIR